MISFQFMICFLLMGSLNSTIVEQFIWPVMNGMKDIYSNSFVMYQREQAGCSECAVMAMIMERDAFSCQNDRLKCLVHDRCLVKSKLSTGTWTTEEGWKHFCTKVQVTSDNSWIDIGPLLTRRRSIQFAVQASQDAYFGLSSGNTSTSSGYWIVLGGWTNTKSCLRDGFVYASSCYSTKSGSLLSSSSYLNFLATWELGNVSVRLSDSSLWNMDYVFPNAYRVTNILLKSMDNTAQWIIYL